MAFNYKDYTAYWRDKVTADEELGHDTLKPRFVRMETGEMILRSETTLQSPSFLLHQTEGSLYAPAYSDNVSEKRVGAFSILLKIKEADNPEQINEAYDASERIGKRLLRGLYDDVEELDADGSKLTTFIREMDENRVQWLSTGPHFTTWYGTWFQFEFFTPSNFLE